MKYGIPIRIRALTSDDWDILRAVRLRSLQESPKAFTSTYGRECEFDEATWRERVEVYQWFVAYDGDQSVGIAAGASGWTKDPATRELIGMWVDPSHRSVGVARTLLDAVAAWAQAQGASTLRLGVVEGNDGARAAYLALGLRSIDERMAVWNDPTTFIEIIERDLDA